jgi:hypothetical protein
MKPTLPGPTAMIGLMLSALVTRSTVPTPKETLMKDAFALRA